MKGTRPLDSDEIRRVSACFTGTYAVRNRGLFLLGVSTGGRISELLSLRIGDVYQNGRAVTDLLFDKSIVKGGEVSRAVPVNAYDRLAIALGSSASEPSCSRSTSFVNLSELDRTMKTSESFQFLGGELKETQDETLFLELALRGYDLSKLRENETTGEVVKIGEISG